MILIYRLDFSRYHEPTSHKKYIIEKIKIARSYLPNANISLNTNSDYMTKEYHQQLLEAGVSNFAFQAYMKNGDYSRLMKMRCLKELIKYVIN